MTDLNGLYCEIITMNQLLKASLALNHVSVDNVVSQPELSVLSSKQVLLTQVNKTLDAPLNAKAALIQLIEGSFIYRIDGTTIVEGQGYVYSIRNGFIPFVKDVNLINFVGSPTAKLFVTFYG